MRALIVVAGMVAAIAATGTASAGPSRSSHEFSFVLESGPGNGHAFRVDSRAGTVTQDMVLEPDTTIALRLTDRELRELAARFRKERLMEVAEPHPPYPTLGFPKPEVFWTLDVRLDGRHRLWKWQDPSDGGGGVPGWTELSNAVRSIMEMVTSKPEWKRLPPPRAFYD